MSHQKVTSKFPTNQQAAARHLPCLGQHAMKAGYQLGRNFIGCDIVFDGFHGEAHEQPEAYSERSGKRDLRGAYGVHAREMCAWLMHLQQARAVNVVFFGILETPTTTSVALNTDSRWKVAAPHASSRLSSIKSSPCSG